jgi:hypothetical protein
MDRAPWSYIPGTYRIANGRPAYGSDAMEVDRYSTWLAAVRKALPPVCLGRPLDSTTATVAAPFQFTLWVPHYTPAVGFEFLCTGDGTITIGGQQDAYTAEVPVSAYVQATHDFADVSAWGTAGPKNGVSANGLQRALNCNLIAEPQSERFQLVLTDAGARTLKVWQIRPLLFIPGDATVLP